MKRHCCDENKKWGKRVVCYANVLQDCTGIIGSFSDFNDKLKRMKFGGQRVKITYQKESAERNKRMKE